MHWYLEALTKYLVFSGRARRREYWTFVLVNTTVQILLTLGLPAEVGSVAALFFGLFVATPSVAVGVRRLHDTDRSGWWFLLSLIPIIGAIWLSVLMLFDSQPGENQYGANPKGVAA